MKKVYLFVSLILVALMGFKIDTYASYNLPSGNLGYTVIDYFEYEERYATDIETSYVAKFYSIEVEHYLALGDIYNYMENVEATSRLYIVPQVLMNNWIFENNSAIVSATVDVKLGYIIFEYNYLGSNYSYMRLFDVNNVEYYNITMNNLNATSKFINNVSHGTNEEYWKGYDDGYFLGNLDGYNNGLNQSYDNGYDDGYDVGYDVGYDLGLSADLNVAPLFTQLISHIGSVFGLVIFPGVTIGTLVSIPIAFALFKWFMKMFGGK